MEERRRKGFRLLKAGQLSQDAIAQQLFLPHVLTNKRIKVYR